MIQLKRFICFGLLLALLAGPVALAASEATADDAAVEAEDTIIDTTHLETMLDAARDGSAEALAAGVRAENAWNRQMQNEDIDSVEADFFEDERTSFELVVAIADYLVDLGITELDGDPLQLRIVASSLNLRTGPARDYERIDSFAHGTIVTSLGHSEDGWLNITDGELSGWASTIHLAPFDGTPAPEWRDPTPGNPSTSNSGDGTARAASATSHTQDDLFWLALTIQLEAGSDWLCDKHQRLVGEVVLNRVAHYRFPPTTIHGVVHQPGQYPWAARGVRVSISDRAWANARWLLDGGRVANNPNMVFQAQFPQGSSTFATIHCSILNTTTWFGIL